MMPTPGLTSQPCSHSPVPYSALCIRTEQPQPPRPSPGASSAQVLPHATVLKPERKGQYLPGMGPLSPAPGPLTPCGPSAGTGASCAARAGAEGGTRGQGCPGASGSGPSPAARPSWRGQKRQTCPACRTRGGEVSLARAQAPRPHPQDQPSSDSREKGPAAPLAPSPRKLDCAGHHLPGSQQSLHEELGTPFLPDHWQVEGETSL